MEYVLTKTFAIESVLTGLAIYNFPRFTILTCTLVCALYFYRQKSKKTTQNIERIYMNSTFYNTDGTFSINKIKLPKIAKNELLVQVKAASINPVDYKVRTVSIPFLRWFMEPTVGRDFSGIVLDIGETVTNFKIGDEVYGNASGGSLQEFTNVKENQIGYKASNISFAEQASIGLAGGTSLQALKYWGDLNNKKVLIIGASGGCGSLGVQIAKYYNARVYAICSSKNSDMVSKLGADKIFNYDDPNYLDKIQHEDFDLIYDTVTSPEDSNQEIIYRKYLNQNGKYVAINASPADWIKGLLARLGLNFQRKDYHLLLLDWNTKDLNEIKKMIEENKLRSNYQSFELNNTNVNSAFDLLKSRRTVGKIVFEI
jgi:NADPH:quinone reductase-like Zn-dependent oxidoreductase